MVAKQSVTEVEKMGFGEEGEEEDGFADVGGDWLGLGGCDWGLVLWICG